MNDFGFLAPLEGRKKRTINHFSVLVVPYRERQKKNEFSLLATLYRGREKTNY